MKLRVRFSLSTAHVTLITTTTVIEFAPPSAGEHKLFEISTSPLSMFYVPLVRTLDQVSAETVQHVRRITTLDAEGNETVTEEVDEVPKERVLNYTPIGNYKWSAIEVNTRDLDHPVAKLELVADGKVAYKYVVATLLIHKTLR
jgi:alkaline phosphatase D